MRMGGLGLRSATRMAPAAHWASWFTLCTWYKRGFPLWFSQLWSNWKLQAWVRGATSMASVGCVHLPSLTFSEYHDRKVVVHSGAGSPHRMSWSDAPPPWRCSGGRHRVHGGPGLTRSGSTLNSSMATDAGWWSSLSRSLEAVDHRNRATTHHPICNGQLFCPGGAVFVRTLVAQSSHPHALAGVDGEVPIWLSASRKSERLWLSMLDF